MSARAPALWLVRHAQPLIAPGVCYGQLDVPADPGATLEAALRLATALPRTAAARHSPLQRCELLALDLQGLSANWMVDARLQEMDFGAWEGQPWNAIDRTQMEAWSSDLYLYAPGGGESLSAMLQRVRLALLESWQHDSQHGQRDVVWVTHAGVIRCVQWLLRYGQAQPSAQDWSLPAPGFGQYDSWPWAGMEAALRSLAVHNRA